MGSNMAENHPVGFQWVVEAKKRGARIIHVDPRFTRTSALADHFVALRAGSDIAFLGAIVRYILEEDRAFKEYVVRYTNAATIVSEDFRDTEELDGLFSGWDPETGTYDPQSWQYEDMEVAAASGQRELGAPTGQAAHGAHGGALEEGEAPHEDPRLQHPRCVYQLLRRHFARYTPELVEETCGVSRADFLAVCEALCENSGRERTSALCYAVGWTQHTVGVQYIRTAAIIQLLLGNIGRPGGGILALRGHASIQGSTDIPTLYDILPGYLPMPSAPVHGVAGRLRRAAGAAGRLLGQHEGVHGVAAEGVVGRRGHGRERLLLRPSAASDGRPLLLLDARGHGRRDGQGPVRHGREPDRGRRQRAATTARRCAASNGSSCATSWRSRRRPSGTTRRRSRAASWPRPTSPPRSS